MSTESEFLPEKILQVVGSMSDFILHYAGAHRDQGAPGGTARGMEKRHENPRKFPHASVLQMDQRSSAALKL